MVSYLSLNSEQRRKYLLGFASVIAATIVILPSVIIGAPTKDDQTVAPGSKEALFFESKIRPILANNCLKCHDDRQSRGEVRLDSREGMMKSRGGLLNLSEPAKSKLIVSIDHSGAIKMPPGGMLRPEEVASVLEWVKMGAPWPAKVVEKAVSGGVTVTAAKRNFWSFRSIKTPTLPPVKMKNWVKSPIDAFILASLERNGLQPAPAADRRSLIRRATVDLIGLPPTPEEVDNFVNDKSPNAWEKVIDRLLSSPHYGERWGRRWLDLVRYADSNGLDENVAMAHAYRYRDYVIGALNKDKPYNTFITEQLAGDLMRSESEEQKGEQLTATGFLTLGPKVLAEPDKEKMVMDIVDEQIEVTSKAFLGLTVACARCHDHKFDPIPTTDYYALAGIFKSTRTMETLNTVAKWNERKLVTASYEKEKKAYEPKIEMARKALDSVKAPKREMLLAAYNQNRDQYLKAAWELAALGEPLSIANSPRKPGEAKRTFFEAEKFARGNVGIDTTGYGAGIGIIHNIGGPDFAEWEFNISEPGLYQLEARYASAEVRPIKLTLNGKVINDHACATNTGSFNPDGQRWEVVGQYEFQSGKNVLRLDAPNDIPHIDKFMYVSVKPRNTGQTALSAEQIATKYNVDLNRLRLLAPYEKGMPDPSGLGTDALANAGKAMLDRLARAFDQKPDSFLTPADAKLIADAAADLKRIEDGSPKPPVVMAVDEGKVENCKVHVRGDTLNLGPEVPRHFLTVLCPDTPKPLETKQSGRMELAKWIADPAHPLTGRVAVNRIWQDHFGEGLVRTPDNWGLLGLVPTHPELLDWLAATFTAPMPATASRKIDGTINAYGCDWSFKKLHKLIMLSNTYQMATLNTPAVAQKASTVDPDNKLLWHFNKRRMEAEPFRDSILFVAGTLDTTMGGTLLKTENHGYVTNDQSGNAANYGARRRSIYLPIIRNALFDMFLAFDMGDPSIVNAKRSSTTVTPQALYVMNSQFVLEQSSSFAESLLREKNLTDEQRLDLAYKKAMGRSITAAETTKLLNYIKSYETRLPATITDAAVRHEKAWTSACQVIFASNEFIYLN